MFPKAAALALLALVFLPLASTAEFPVAPEPPPGTAINAQWYSKWKAVCPTGECWVFVVYRRLGPCPGDVTGDGRTDGLDYIRMMQDWNCQDDGQEVPGN